MRNVKYTVLEYAKSDLDPSGIQFLITLRDQGASGVKMKLVVRKDWPALVAEGDHFDREYIQDIVYEINQQHFRNTTTAEDFFSSIERLNMGPVRTSVCGCAALYLDAVQQYGINLDAQEVSFCSAKVLEQLVHLLQHTTRS